MCEPNNAILQTLPMNFVDSKKLFPPSNETIQNSDKIYLNSIPIKYSDLAINNLMNFQERMTIEINKRVKYNFNSNAKQCNNKICLNLDHANTFESQRSLSNNEMEKLVNRLSHDHIHKNSVSPMPGLQGSNLITKPENIYERLSIDNSSRQNKKLNNLTISPSKINKFFQTEQNNLRLKEQKLEIMRIEKNRSELLEMQSLSPPISPEKFQDFLSKEKKFISDKWKYIAEKNAIKEAGIINELKNFFHPKINKHSQLLNSFKDSDHRRMMNPNKTNINNNPEHKEEYKTLNKELFFEKEHPTSSSKIRIRSKLECSTENENRKVSTNDLKSKLDKKHMNSKKEILTINSNDKNKIPDNNFDKKHNFTEKPKLNSTYQYFNEKWRKSKKMKYDKKMESFILDNKRRIEMRNKEMASKNANILKIPQEEQKLSSSIKYYNLGFPSERQKAKMNIFSTRLNLGLHNNEVSSTIFNQHYSPFSKL